MNSFYIASSCGLLIHTILLVINFRSNTVLSRKIAVVIFYMIDVIIVTWLLWMTRLDQSLFLFIFLVLILLSGLQLGLKTSFSIAAVTSILFSVVLAVQSPLQSLNFFFMMILNNTSFFFVAFLAGKIGEDLSLYKIQLSTKDINLAAEKKLNELILESVSVGLLAVNKNYEILVKNQSARKILRTIGSPRTDFLSEIFEFLKNVDLNELSTQFSAETSIQLKDSDLIHFYRIAVNPEQSRYFEEPVWIVSVQDITELKHLEYSGRQSEKMAAIGGLAAGIAHEIRNPLASISGSIQMISQNFVSDDDKKLGKIIIKEIDRLNRLISEFLDFSKPEVPPSTKIELASLCEEVLGVIKNQSVTNSSGAVIHYEVDLERIEIIGSWDKLKQALMNIIMNAIQALDQQIEPKIVILCRRVESSEAEIVIQDNGCGMTEKTKQRMFEAFHTTKPKGTGLGLAITHKILQSHDAHVWVESEVGIGTKFYIRIPIKSFDLRS